MDNRKYIIILCLLFCHALGGVAATKQVLNYQPISNKDVRTVFEFFGLEREINVIGVDWGDYKLVGRYDNRLAASSKTGMEYSFALKLECDGPIRLSCLFRETNKLGDGYVPMYQHVIIVDGKKIKMPISKKKVKFDKAKIDIKAGKHEIIITSSKVGKSEEVRSVYLEPVLHYHTMKTTRTCTVYCGRDGFIRKACEMPCDYVEWTDLPMPAKKCNFINKLDWQGTCLIGGDLNRECVTCGKDEYYKLGRKSATHNFQNGQCTNQDCKLKLPVQNAAGVYQVGDAYELRGLAEQIAAGYIPRDCNIDLTADITYPENLAHFPIGTTDNPFAGTFDGHGHHICNMPSRYLTDMTGLFGVVEGTPRRLAVIANVIIDSDLKLKGTNMIGAVAGRADYCDIIRCVSRATVIGISNVGGIVGYSKHGCHLIDCAGLGIIDSKENGGLLSGTLRQGYVMDSYGCGRLANGGVEPALVLTADSPLRHCFQLDAKTPMTGVTTFSSAQLSDGTLARMLCEKRGEGVSAHWQQGTTEGCPMPVFVELTDRPAPAIQPQAAKAAISAFVLNSYSEEEGEEEEELGGELGQEPEGGVWEQDEGWLSSSLLESELIEDSPEENFVFYDEADSTLTDYNCYVSTTFHKVPTMPMFAAMQGGDAKECDVIYAKRDSTVIMEYNYTIDGWRYTLAEATTQYMTPDSLVHLESYAVEEKVGNGELLMTDHIVLYPDNSGYKEKVSYGVATRVLDWEVSQTGGTEPLLTYYLYDEDGQQRVEAYSLASSDDKEDENDDFDLPGAMDYTLDENGRLKDVHYVLTDSITGEKYNIGGEYYIYDEQGEVVQVVTYEPVEPHSREMRQTEYCTIQNYKAEDASSSIIPIWHLQPGTLDGSPTRTSGHVYDMHGKLVRLNNDATALKSLPKGIYITRGKKIMVY